MKILGYDTTPASVHDSQRGAELVDDNDAVGEMFWLDAGYVGTEDGFANILPTWSNLLLMPNVPA